MSQRKRKRGNDGLVDESEPGKTQDNSSNVAASPKAASNSQTVNQHILEALRAQNNLLRNNFRVQNDLLRDLLKRLNGRPQQGPGIVARRSQQDAPPQHGSWKFVESFQALRTKDTYSKDTNHLEEIPLFGNAEGSGETLTECVNKLSYSVYSNNQRQGILQYNLTFRSLLPMLVFNENIELKQQSGIYNLTLKYNGPKVTNEMSLTEAGIIIGEVEFNNNGAVHAEGADWDRLFNGQSKRNFHTRTAHVECHNG